MAKRMRGLYKRGRVWWAAFKGLDDLVLRISTGTADYDKAVEFLEDRKREVRDGNEPEIKKIPDYTFRELAGEYLKWCERQRSYRSKKGFISQLTDTFGHMKVRRIGTKIIEQFQSERLQKGNKPATINRLLATLKHCVHKGYQWEMLSEDTLKRVRQVHLLEENNKRLRFLSREECQKLLALCKGELRSIVTTALHTGMRKGEILSLTWDRVDLKHGFILLDKTKNGDRREIPINETLRITLQGLTRRLDIPYVFFDSVTGKNYQDVKRSFNTSLRRAGITDFRFHDLRHTFASHLVMAGVDITTVSRLLGHKSLTMTLRYAHLAPAHMTRAVNILDSTLNEISTSHLLHSTTKKELAVNA